jgi:adenylate cyclase
MAERSGGTPIPISLTLATSIGLLVAIAVGVVFWTQWSTARKNTNELVSQRANLYADQIIKDLDAQLQPARHQADFIADRIQRGALDPGDAEQFETALISSLAAAAEIVSITFLNTQLQTVGARRETWNTVRMFRADRSGTPHIVAAFRQTEKAKAGFWGDILFVEGLTLVNRRVPVRRDGKFIGLVASLISITEVSNLIAQFTKSLGSTGFVLYGRDKVLAHPILKTAHPGQSVKAPLVALSAIDDAVLNALALQLEDPNDKGTPFANRFERRKVTVGEEDYFTFVHWIGSFGETPWGVGAWLKARDVDVAQRRVLQAG